MYSQSSLYLNYYSPPLLFLSPPIQCSILQKFRGNLTWRTKDTLVDNNCNASRTSTTCRIQVCMNALQEYEDDNEFNGITPEDAIDYIKRRLKTIGDGRISISPYDTAWVALIPDINAQGTPHFPSCLEWIVKNQLSDGSWGDAQYFSAYDRLLCTLACVIALETWNVHPENSETGIKFIKGNMSKLESGDDDNMTIGFELVFPALLEKALNLGIDLTCDSSMLKEMYMRRDRKMKRIPREVMHTVHTSLLFSLEGIIKDLDWEKLFKLRTPSGSFLTSPSSTAFAVMETKDDSCLTYLENIVANFNGGVPYTFPVDLFARNYGVDRLQRLGISHYFKSEIDECMSYVNRYWTKNGIFSTRDSVLCDVEDTAMGFRLLRLHGYNVNPDAFAYYKDGDKFFCLQGELNESPTSIFHLYRASQVLFPGEKILEDAKKFSYKFLKERVDTNQFLDKWSILKDLAGEVRYVIEVPWYASLPRVETRFYIEQYGGVDDVWIGKCLYRMPDVNNDVYLDLARLDFNKCQAHHQMEWNNILKWYEKYNLQRFGISRDTLLLAHFLATANLFESEKMIERLAWAKTIIISRAVKSYLWEKAISSDQRITFIKEFENSLNDQAKTNGNNNIDQPSVLSILLDFIQQLSQDSFKQLGKDIQYQLHDAWKMWLIGVNKEEAFAYQEKAELIVRTLNVCAGFIDSLDIYSHIDYKSLTHLTNKICHKLENHHIEKAHSMERLDINMGNDMEIESDFQELLQLVLQNSPNSISGDIKQTFLAVAKTYYYTAYCSQETVDSHISKVLFEPIL